MKASLILSALLLVIGTSALAGEPANVLADLDPGLQQVLVRDAACTRPSALPQDDFSRVPVKEEEIRSGGREAGVIVSPQDTCHCEGENCSTFVYIKSGESYTLTLQNRFASLRPMKIVKHGLPSLSGKLQVSPVQEETTVYDWNGQEYQPSLCATVVQRKNQRLPSITQHPCGRAARTVAAR